jgi:hypothetical protein
MPRIHAVSLAVLVLLALVLTGCGDDDPPTVPDQPFQLALAVTLPDGSPAAGIRVAGMPRLDPMMPPVLPEDGGGGPWHRVNIGVDMMADGLVTVTIHDVTGAEVRSLVVETLPAGLYLFEWDGRDDAGLAQPGGWYRAHVVLDWAEGTGMVHDLPLILEACDPDWHAYGSTGADGILVIDDPRLVPALLDPEPVGQTELTGLTLLRLENDHGDGQYLTVDATDGSNEVWPVWQPDYESFRIEVLVLDPAGEPVPDADIAVMPALPSSVFPWGPGRGDARPAVVIPFDLEEQLAVRLDIQDITGAPIRTLDLGAQPAGAHQLVWDGNDDLGEPMFSGWYEAVLRISAYGGDPYWTVVDSTSMLKVVPDPERIRVAVTDAEGRALITDRRLVPAFWDPPPLTHRDENANDLGLFELTTETWLYVAVPGSEFVGTWASVDAIDGAQAVEVTLTAVPPQGAPDAGPVLRSAPRDVDTPPLTTRLHGVYPNPFN